MVRALTGLGHEVDLLTFPQGEDGGAPRPAPPPQPAAARGTRAGRAVPGQAAARRAVHGRGLRGAWPSAATTSCTRSRRRRTSRRPCARLLRLPLVVDVDSSIPDQLRYSGFATRRPAALAGRSASRRHALRALGGRGHGLREPHEGVRATAPARPRLPDRGPAARRSRRRRSPPRPSPRCGAALGLGRRPVVLYSGQLRALPGRGAAGGGGGRAFPEAQFLFMGGEPAEIEALRAQRARPRAARCVFAGKRPPARAAAPSWRSADVLVSPARPGREHAVQGLHLPGLGQAARGHAHPHPHPAPGRQPGLPGGADRRGTGGGHPRGARATRARPGARAAAGRALIEREYSPARYAEKVERAYAAVAAQLEEGDPDDLERMPVAKGRRRLLRGPDGGRAPDGGRRDRLRPVAALRARSRSRRSRAPTAGPRPPWSWRATPPPRASCGTSSRAASGASWARPPLVAEAVAADGALVVGTPATSPLVAGLGWAKDLAPLGPEGYLIRSTRVGGHAATVIASSGEAGTLYGAFHLLRLMQTGQTRGGSPNRRAAPHRAPAAEPLGQPRRHHRARLRRPLALGVGRAAGTDRPARRRLRARERVDRHQRRR